MSVNCDCGILWFSCESFVVTSFKNVDIHLPYVTQDLVLV